MSLSGAAMAPSGQFLSRCFRTIVPCHRAPGRPPFCPPLSPHYLPATSPGYNRSDEAERRAGRRDTEKPSHSPRGSSRSHAERKRAAKQLGRSVRRHSGEGAKQLFFHCPPSSTSVSTYRKHGVGGPSGSRAHAPGPVRTTSAGGTRHNHSTAPATPKRRRAAVAPNATAASESPERAAATRAAIARACAAHADSPATRRRWDMPSHAQTTRRRSRPNRCRCASPSRRKCRRSRRRPAVAPAIARARPSAWQRSAEPQTVQTRHIILLHLQPVNVGKRWLHGGYAPHGATRQENVVRCERPAHRDEHSGHVEHVWRHQGGMLHLCSRRHACGARARPHEAGQQCCCSHSMCSRHGNG